MSILQVDEVFFLKLIVLVIKGLVVGLQIFPFFEKVMQLFHSRFRILLENKDLGFDISLKFSLQLPIFLLQRFHLHSAFDYLRMALELHLQLFILLNCYSALLFPELTRDGWHFALESLQTLLPQSHHQFGAFQRRFKLLCQALESLVLFCELLPFVCLCGPL